MADVYLYLDETGDLGVSGKSKESRYFGLGSAMFVGDHAQEIWAGMQLRLALEAENLRMPDGMHAHKDKPTVKHRVLSLIARQRPRIDITLLRKERAYPSVQAKMRGDRFYIYEYAWYVHFKYLARYVIPRHLDRETDRAYIVVATLGTGEQKEVARRAIERVCAQFPKLNMTVCIWDNKTAWGLQVADYALWAAQREVLRGQCGYYQRIRPFVKTLFLPWEKVRTPTGIPAVQVTENTESTGDSQPASVTTLNPETEDHFDVPGWWEELPDGEWEDVAAEDLDPSYLRQNRWAAEVPDVTASADRFSSDPDLRETWLHYVPDPERLAYASSTGHEDYDDEELPEEWRDEVN
jgi:hypothetical protein